MSLKEHSFSQINHETMFVPSSKLVKLVYPEKGWYEEHLDQEAHQRPLYLTRGMHIIQEWWEKQDIHYGVEVSKDVQYQLGWYADLEQTVRQMHKILAPHQKIDDAIILFGLGATQILHATLYGLSMYHSVHQNSVHHGRVPISFLYATHQVPGYVETKFNIDLNHGSRVAWIDFEEHERVSPDDLIEFVTSPNNPDGRLLQPATKARYIVKDRVNHWELFMHDFEAYKQETLEHDLVSVFSLSKILSFSGSRVGYAIIRDPQLAHYMHYYIIANTHGVVTDGHIRCLVALKHLINHNRLHEYTNAISGQLKERWERLQEAVYRTYLDLLNHQGPCAWFRAPSDSHQYFHHHYGIEGTYGAEYGAGPEYIRINMLCKSNEFEEFIWRLKNK